MNIKPSDILKWLVGTKEGRAYYRKEVNQWCKDMAKDMEKQLFGESKKKGVD